MTTTQIAGPTSEPVLTSDEHYRVEQFYYQEAALLDDRHLEEWLELFTEDLHYWMPLRRTMLREQLDQEFTKPGEMALFDDTKDILTIRVRKLATGYAWAEDPPSRTRHLFTNIRVLGVDGNELTATCNFLLYRSRGEHEQDTWLGRREDVLRRDGTTFRIARRHIFVEQTVMLAKNLSNFF